MPAEQKHRDRIVRAAAKLFRQGGYTATGTNDIVALSQAPKGSLYHYFPAGKAQIGAEAVRYAGELVSKTLGDMSAGRSAAELIVAYGTAVAGWMAQSGFRDGCPITTTLLEMAPADAAITEAGARTFAGWAAIFEATLQRDGAAAVRARSLSTMAIASLQGALTLARVQRSAEPIHTVVHELAMSFAAALDQAVGSRP